MQASMTKHSSSTATVSAGGEALLAATAGPVAIVAGESVSDGTTSPGSADASLIVGSCAGATSLLTATGSVEITDGGASVGSICAGSVEVVAVSGAAVSAVAGLGAAATAAAMAAVNATPSSM